MKTKKETRTHQISIVLMGVALALALHVIAYASDAKKDTETTWTDPATGLMWAGQDSGENMKWTRAQSYCTNLRLDAYSNWRLPTIDELTGIYDQTQDVNHYHIKGDIKISGTGSNVLSKSAGQSPGQSAAFFFPVGVRNSFPYAYSVRTLCVRHSGE